jgi:penicillin-binding protein 2
MLDNETIRGQLISRRTLVIGAGKLGMLFLLASRLFYMQFIKKDQYKTLSDKNRISIIIITPVRGQIYDINDIIIAKNNPCFRLLLDKSGNPKYSNEIKLITQLLSLEADQIEEINYRIKTGGKKFPVMIIDCLDWQQVSSIEERKAELVSIFVDTGYKRFYKSGFNTAHLLGYMGSPKKEQQKEFGIIDKNFKVGKSGIEEFYENSLRGQFGHKQIEINAFGKFIRSLAKSDSISGNDLKLYIDSELQGKVRLLLSEQGASAIVIDCTNGGVLLLSSSPSFEPNNFNNLSTKYWNSLINNPYRPLINKTIQSTYPPGSVFKIITFLAALEAGFNPDTKISCNGSSALGRYFHCSSKQGHGLLDMTKAIQYSCNSYVFEVAKIIGPDKIEQMARRFGFGKKTGIDLCGEQNGFVPSRAWKEERHGNKWSMGDTLNLSIGQGFLLSTPIQIAKFITAIATDGKLFVPMIVQGETRFTNVNIKQEYIAFIKHALYAASNNIGGTSYYSKLNLDGIKMSGKTGTAQVQSKSHINDDLSHANIAWERRNHAIFAGYAPSDNPKYAVSVYFDHGGGGGKNAAPIARDIMKEVLLKYYNTNSHF